MSRVVTRVLAFALRLNARLSSMRARTNKTNAGTKIAKPTTRQGVQTNAPT